MNSEEFQTSCDDEVAVEAFLDSTDEQGVFYTFDEMYFKEKEAKEWNLLSPNIVFKDLFKNHRELDFRSAPEVHWVNDLNDAVIQKSVHKIDTLLSEKNTYLFAGQQFRALLDASIAQGDWKTLARLLFIPKLPFPQKKDKKKCVRTTCCVTNQHVLNAFRIASNVGANASVLELSAAHTCFLILSSAQVRKEYFHNCPPCVKTGKLDDIRWNNLPEFCKLDDLVSLVCGWIQFANRGCHTHDFVNFKLEPLDPSNFSAESFTSPHKKYSFFSPEERLSNEFAGDMDMMDSQIVDSALTKETTSLLDICIQNRSTSCTLFLQEIYGARLI